MKKNNISRVKKGVLGSTRLNAGLESVSSLSDGTSSRAWIEIPKQSNNSTSSINNTYRENSFLHTKKADVSKQRPTSKPFLSFSHYSRELCSSDDDDILDGQTHRTDNSHKSDNSDVSSSLAENEDNGEEDEEQGEEEEEKKNDASTTRRSGSVDQYVTKKLSVSNFEDQYHSGEEKENEVYQQHQKDEDENDEKQEELSDANSKSSQLPISCPVCMEELDSTDRCFYPCLCGYQLCLWCLHHIREHIGNRCPACRREYNESNYTYNREKHETTKQLQTDKSISKPREGATTPPKPKKQPSPKQPPKYRSLADVRVIRRTLVYVIGLPASHAKKETLRKMFSKYGRILNININKNPSTTTPNRGVSAYITYPSQNEAEAAIQATDGAVLEDGSLLRASFGTTKYCCNFLRKVKCTNVDCFYLHRFGEECDSFTAREMITAKHQFHDLTFPFQSAKESESKKENEEKANERPNSILGTGELYAQQRFQRRKYYECRKPELIRGVRSITPSLQPSWASVAAASPNRTKTTWLPKKEADPPITTTILQEDNNPVFTTPRIQIPPPISASVLPEQETERIPQDRLPSPVEPSEMRRQEGETEGRGVHLLRLGASCSPSMTRERSRFVNHTDTEEEFPFPPLSQVEFGVSQDNFFIASSTSSPSSEDEEGGFCSSEKRRATPIFQKTARDQESLDLLKSLFPHVNVSVSDWPWTPPVQSNYQPASRPTTTPSYRKDTKPPMWIR